MRKVLAQLLVVSTMVILLSGLSIATAQTEEEAEHSEESSVVRDSALIFLGGQTLAANDFIHLYDTTPYHIMNGHVAAKLPCDDNSESPVEVLIGAAPNLTAAEFEQIGELSTPGQSCLYHVDLESTENSTITDIAIRNPTAEPIEFGPSSTVVIGINEVMKAAHEPHAEGESGEHAEGESGEENAEHSANETNSE
jgi:hypothetical protein